MDVVSGFAEDIFEIVDMNVSHLDILEIYI